jgi:hypothetical protein
MSYVHDIRYRRFISYTTSYAHTMSHVNIRYCMSDVRYRTSFRGGRFRCFKGTIIPFIIRIPCTILVIAVLRRQGWTRVSKDNDVLWCNLNNFCSCIYRILYRIRYRTSDVRYRMSKYRFLPVVRAISNTMSYTTEYVFYTTLSLQHTTLSKNVRHSTFFTGSCQSYVQHRIRHRTFFDDVAYDVQCNIGIIRCRTEGSVVVGSHRLKHRI